MYLFDQWPLLRRIGFGTRPTQGTGVDLRQMRIIRAHQLFESGQTAQSPVSNSREWHYVRHAQGFEFLQFGEYTGLKIKIFRYFVLLK